MGNGIRNLSRNIYIYALADHISSVSGRLSSDVASVHTYWVRGSCGSHEFLKVLVEVNVVEYLLCLSFMHNFLRLEWMCRSCEETKHVIESSIKLSLNALYSTGNQLNFTNTAAVVAVNLRPAQCILENSFTCWKWALVRRWGLGNDVCVLLRFNNDEYSWNHMLLSYPD